MIFLQIMSTTITNRDEKGFKMEITIPYGKTILEAEEIILQSINEAGSLATGEILQQFDTDGSPIIVGGQKWTSKGQSQKTYETPYGKTQIKRHVYQNSQGGKTYCPLDVQAKIVCTSTPRFAKMMTSKYAEFSSRRVENDLLENHGVTVPIAYIQNICDIVGSIASIKEDYWEYELPKIEKPIKTITIGLDGTCVLMAEEGYRQAMVGTISLYDAEGIRQHTAYTASSPEYGKVHFLEKLEYEIKRVKDRYPQAEYIGIADGAKDNWSFLEQHTDKQVLDFYHASEYVGEAGKIMHKNNFTEEESWISKSCHNLKHEEGAIDKILKEIEDFKDVHEAKLSLENRDKIKTTITYFKNNQHRMLYAQNTKQNLPIGSGVTEAACKVIVKQRLGCSGMRWKKEGAALVLLLRCLSYSTGRWNQFWDKIDKFGFSLSL